MDAQVARLVSQPTLALMSTRDAPPLIDMVPAEANIFLEEFGSRMLPPPEVAAVIQEIRREPGCHDGTRLLRSVRSHALPSPFDPLACLASSS